jgi:hypothetical protein
LSPELDVAVTLPPFPETEWTVIGGDRPVWDVGSNAILATEMLGERIRLITCGIVNNLLAIRKKADY